MANTGDFYTVQLKAPHLDWGEIRYTDTRTPSPEKAIYLFLQMMRIGCAC